MKTIRIPISWALYYTMQLFIGAGYKELSSKRRKEILNEFLESFNSLGEVEIDEETYKVVQDSI